MVVGVHQAARQHVPAELVGDSPKAAHECGSVAVILDDSPPAVSLRDDVMDSTGLLASRRTGHRSSVVVFLLGDKWPDGTGVRLKSDTVHAVVASGERVRLKSDWESEVCVLTDGQADADLLARDSKSD
jgi:hypothetical protein